MANKGVQEIWGELSKTLGALDEIQHVDLWNQNVDFLGEEEAWSRPAVFVEFGEIEWKSTKENEYFRGYGRVTLHIVTDWADGKDESAWSTVRRVREAVVRNTDLLVSATRINHDHGEIVETIDEYITRYSLSLGSEQ